MHKLSIWLLSRGRGPVLGFLILVSLVLGSGLVNLQVERDTRSMISRRPQQLALQERLHDLFGNDSILLLSLTRRQLLSSEGLALIAAVSDEIAALNGVERVLSLTSAEHLVGGRYGVKRKSLLTRTQDGGFNSEELAETLNGEPLYRDLLLSADQQTAGMIVIPSDHMIDSAGLPQLIRNLRSIMAIYREQAEFHLTGVAVQQSDVADYIRRDQQVVMPLVVTVMTMMLALFLRRASGVLLPLATTALSLIWTLGLYALCDYELNTISALLPPVVMILAISNCVHLYNGWLQLDVGNGDFNVAWAEKIAELAAPCGFTALTTGCGLLSLTLSGIPAVRQFGVFAALGVLFSLLISLTLMPLALVSPPRSRSNGGHRSLHPFLQRIADLSIHRAPLILLLAVVSAALALLSVPRLTNNTNLVAFLDDDAPLAVDTAFIDSQLGGVNMLNFMISRSDGKPFASPDDYRALIRFEELTKKKREVGRVFSIMPLLQRIQQLEAGGQVPLAESEDDLRYQLDLLELATSQTPVMRFLSADRRTARVAVFFHELGSQQVLNVIRELESQGKSIFGNAYRLEPSGGYYSMMLDSELLASDTVRSFSLSLGLVMLSMLILLRSLRLTLVALLPNLVPIIWTIGLMVVLGIDLSSGTAMIGAVAFGLAVDDTIHYLVCFRNVRGNGIEEAVHMTTTGTGRALTITTLALTLGFWSGCFGSFKPTVYFSLLVGGTLIGALLCDLLLLPAALVLFPAVSRGRATCRDS